MTQPQQQTIRERRESLKATQRQIAIRAGVHPATIDRAEAGIGVSPRSLRAIESVLSELERSSDSAGVA